MCICVDLNLLIFDSFQKDMHFCAELNQSNGDNQKLASGSFQMAVLLVALQSAISLSSWVKIWKLLLVKICYNMLQQAMNGSCFLSNLVTTCCNKQ